MKKLFYILCIIAVPIIISFLLYQRTIHKGAVRVQQPAQTIIPTASNQESSTTDDTAYFNPSGTQSVVTLLSDEIFIGETALDINEINKDNKLIAVKKLSDQFLYLLLFLYDADSQMLIRAAEIKTGITQSKTLSFDTLQVNEYQAPIILYRGLNSDNLQVFTVLALDIHTQNDIRILELINIQADGQITLKTDKHNAQQTSITQYAIHACYSDTAAPNTLNQIEKIYRWNEKKSLFTKTNERFIPGKKIESQLLRKLQTGNTENFKEFLEGLWHQPAAKVSQNRSIFFNHKENEIIFSVNNIQEVFTIDLVLSKRNGLYFSTKNTAISSIHRRLNIELTGIDEIAVHVIEDIARIKIGVSSNWDGVYRKTSTAVSPVSADTALNQIKKTLTENEKIWKNANGNILVFSDSHYRFRQEDTEESGWYVLSKMKDKIILQFKNKEDKNTFFMLAFDTADKKKQKIMLTEVSVTLQNVIIKGTPVLIFE